MQSVILCGFVVNDTVTIVKFHFTLFLDRIKINDFTDDKI